MSIRRSAGSIFWGLTLIAIGGLLLARNLGYPIPIWSGIARYWPLLLIVWGLLKLVDYFRFRSSGEGRTLFSGGEVALLILVIMAGSAITTAANLSPEFGRIFDIGDLDLWDITGNNYDYSEHQEADVPAGSIIEIMNMYGSLEVRPSDTDRVILDVRKVVRASSKEEADQMSGEFTFSILNTGSRYRIASSRDGYVERPTRRIERQRFKSSLTIKVPKQSVLQIDNRNGRVSVQDLTGNQNIVNRYGDVEIRGIAGAVVLENRNGTVVVEDVTESANITNSYSAATVKGVGGNLEIKNRNGSVDVSGVKGNATISNSYAPITVQNVQGELAIRGRNNSIDVEHVEGDLKVEASYQNVSIRDATGSITVRNRNGDVLIGLARPPQKDISVSSEYSNVTIELPSAASFGIDARTQYGDVFSEFEGISATSSNRERSMKGQAGQGGPQINIDTRNGNIRVDRRG